MSNPFLVSGSGYRKPLFYVRKRPDGGWMVGMSGQGSLKQFPPAADSRDKACKWRDKASQLWQQKGAA